MPLILLLETSTDVCSVALSKNGEIICLAESIEPNSHTEKLTLLIQQCMFESSYKYDQLDAIALSKGPGSYTSLRIGAATAKGICYAMKIPLITLDSLLILANGTDHKNIHNGIIVPMIDARRMEVYASVYDCDLNVLEKTHPIILNEHTFDQYLLDIHICGNGAEKFLNAFPEKPLTLHQKHTSATFMNTLAVHAFKKNEFSDVAYFTPEYFKGPNITKSLKKLF